MTKYKTEKVDKQYMYSSKVYYSDLDNDSYSECINLHYSGNYTPIDSVYNVPAIVLKTDCIAENLTRIIDQFNFSKKWFKNQSLYFGDFDNDGFKEIYFYTYSNDSLFLQGFDGFIRNGFFLEKFICRFNIYNNQPDLFFGSTIIDYDYNGDGKNEVVGSVIGGYSALPRFVFVFDIINDTLFKSKTSCIYLSVNNIIYDDKGNIYFSTGNCAPGNVKVSMLPDIEFTDYSSWFGLLDKNLDFLFPPIENKGLGSAVLSYFQKENNEIFVYSIDISPPGDSLFILKKYNLTGRVIRSKIFTGPIERNVYRKKEHGDNVLYLKQKQTFQRIDRNLEFNNPKDVEFRNIEFFDLDFDGSEEVFNWQEGEGFAYLYTSDFTHPAKVEIKDLFFGFILSSCKFKDNSANFAIHSGDFVYLFKYFKNPYYLFRFPVYLGIYLLVSFLFYIVMYFQRKSLLQKFSQEKRMTELELLTIKNQIDPHFTFNAINTLSSIFYKEDKKTAHKFLVDFSSLIRNTLNNSKKIAIPIKDEIDFVRNYLKLQQFRYSDKFDFTIKIDKDVDENTMVPRMIIQTFAENSVKHGLVKKEGKGTLSITIHPMTRSHRINEISRLQIEITDDGNGREKSKQVLNYKQISTGKGLEIINQIVGMYNRLEKAKVGFEIVDLKDNEGNNFGTKVIVVI
ncbi:MAG: histidine kinase [Bacteroidales bacterium]